MHRRRDGQRVHRPVLPLPADDLQHMDLVELAHGRRCDKRISFAPFDTSNGRFTKTGSGQTYIGKALKKEGDHFRRRPCWGCCRERLFEYLDGQAEPGKKTKRYFLSVFI